MEKKLILLILALSILLCSCTQGKNKDISNSKDSANVPKVEMLKFTKDTFPKIDGSTATIPLSQAIASKILGMSADEAAKFIKHNTTHNAYVNLLEDKADIIFVTEPSREELKLAEDKNIKLEVIPVVKEGFVFLVNTKNPVNSLTAKQIQDIYQGKIKNWKEVGGDDKEIIAFQREANSGSQTLMEQTFMKGLKLTDSPKNIVHGMAELIESIAKYDNSDKALGYSVYYYAKTMYNKETIKFLAVDGVKPDNKTISSGKYPVTSAYYAVIKASDPKDADSRKLINWLLGAEGQKVGEDAGYVPMKMR